MIFFATKIRKKIENIPAYYWVSIAGWTCRIISAVAQIVTIPMLLKYLGVDSYAIFAILTGLIVWFNLAELGMGASIQNHISSLRAANSSDRVFLQGIGLFILILMGIALFIFSCVSPFLQPLLFRQLPTQVSPYLLLLTGDAYILIAFFTIASRIFFAQQKGYWGYIYQALGYLAALLFLAIICFSTPKRDTLVWVLIAWMLPQVFFGAIGFIHAMPFTGWIKALDFSLFKRLFKQALAFSLNNIGAAFVLGIDYIIISQWLNAESIAIYNILNKIFVFVFFGYSTVLMAVWPMLSEKFALGKTQAILEAHRLLYRNIISGMIYISSAILSIWALKDFILKVLSHGTLTFSVSLIFLFGAYYMIRVWTDTYAMALQSRNKVGFMAAIVPVQACVSVLFLYYFTRWWGLEGVMIGLILCYLLTAAWMLPVYYYRSLRFS